MKIIVSCGRGDSQRHFDVFREFCKEGADAMA